VFFLLIIFITISAISYANTVSKDLAKNLFRLHVVANSDKEEDQNLKYIVRDKVLEYVSRLSKDLKNKEEVINLVENNMEDIKRIAKDVVTEEGYDYDVNISLGNFSFPTKEYGDISLPSRYV
jgi:stage II sporulation protein R